MSGFLRDLFAWVSQSWAFALSLGLMVCLVAKGGLAAGPGVPVLPASPAGYVAYAVDNLPNYYTNGPVAATDNTPVDNPITDAGAELGRVLFYDDRLSHNDGASCASCHVQENGFSDPNELSIGFEGGLTGRHSMGLTNAKFYERGSFFWDERAATLEEQVLMPIQDEVEMGSNLPDLVAELQSTQYYPELFERAFGDSTVSSERMAQAMAQFVRSMTSYQSKYDVAREAGRAGSPAFRAQLTAEEAAGHALFATNCAGCHGTDAHVADVPQNIGLDATNDEDNGINGRFKVPSLRNLAVRDGFMHDGRFATLEEVIEFYSSQIQDNPRLGPGLTPGGFNFTEAEKTALLAFLNTLTDEVFLTSELFSDPFAELTGDYNADGIVDMDDYTAWRDAFGETFDGINPLLADGNGDGTVDAADYSLWRDNLGLSWLSLQLGFSSVAIPEPSAIWLLLTLISWRIGSRRVR